MYISRYAECLFWNCERPETGWRLLTNILGYLVVRHLKPVKWNTCQVNSKLRGIFGLLTPVLAGEIYCITRPIRIGPIAWEIHLLDYGTFIVSYQLMCSCSIPFDFFDLAIKEIFVCASNWRWNLWRFVYSSFCRLQLTRTTPIRISSVLLLLLSSDRVKMCTQVCIVNRLWAHTIIWQYRF